ncbi:hypothetical protein ZOSMA_64G00790 [Zostera marina]|uniref:Uncharacterized protein n=1 Tax=Zostera marina TaxID=29655 RepID=A0A0K9NUX5_ZOSMR|nr:hypothetical protein ZOSMA_64G00790 [Zostera marina]
MARFIFQTLIPISRTLIQTPQFVSALRSSSRLLNFRSHSNKSEKKPGALVEIDLSGIENGGEDYVMGLNRLEEAIHSIMIKRSVPDWLPFIPGSSYWVPPIDRSAAGTLKIMDFANKTKASITCEEAMSLTTVRGWPSTTYFVQGRLPLATEEQVENKNAKSDDDDA